MRIRCRLAWLAAMLTVMAGSQVPPAHAAAIDGDSSRAGSPIGAIEYPANEPGAEGVYFRPGDSLFLQGWALSKSSSIRKVKVYLDGHLLRSINLFVPRPEICASYPGYRGCDSRFASRIGYSADISSSRLSLGSHVLKVVAHDLKGRTVSQRQLIGTTYRARDLSLQVRMNGSSPIDLSTSVDIRTSGFLLLQGPAHGVLEGDPPLLTYSPEEGYLGKDEFSFAASDGGGLQSNPAKAFIHVSSPTAPLVLGEARTAVVLITFEGDPSPITPEEARIQTFDGSDSVRAWFEETSKGRFTISGDVFGPIQVPRSGAPCDMTAGRDAAYALLRQDGVDIAQYDYALLAYSQCAPGGASGGSPAETYPKEAVFGPGSFTPSITVHEMGHALGLSHANGFLCDDGGSICRLANWINDEYNDPHDTMGAGNLKHYSGYEQRKLGWLDSNRSLTVEANGRYRLAASHSPAGRFPSLIRIPRSRGPDAATYTYFYLEYRTQTGFDTRVASIDSRGLHVRIATNDELPETHAAFSYGHNALNSKLVDLHPATHGDFTDAPLRAGDSFDDAEFGVHLSLLTESEDHADVEIRLEPPPCIRSAPSIVFLETSREGRGGDVVFYPLRMINNDAGTCPASAIQMRGTPEPVLSNSSVLLGAYSDLLSGASTRDRQYILGGPVVDYDPPAILAIPPDAGAGLYRIDTTCWNATLNDFYVSAESLELSLLP